MYKFLCCIVKLNFFFSFIRKTISINLWSHCRHTTEFILFVILLLRLRAQHTYVSSEISFCISTLCKNNSWLDFSCHWLWQYTYQYHTQECAGNIYVISTLKVHFERKKNTTQLHFLYVYRQLASIEYRVNTCHTANINMRNLFVWCTLELWVSNREYTSKFLHTPYNSL